MAEATPFFVMFADKIRTTKVREKRKDVNPIKMIESYWERNEDAITEASVLRIYQVIRTAATTRRPLSRVYSQVDRQISLSPYWGVMPVS